MRNENSELSTYLKERKEYLKAVKELLPTHFSKLQFIGTLRIIEKEKGVLRSPSGYRLDDYPDRLLRAITEIAKPNTKLFTQR